MLKKKKITENVEKQKREKIIIFEKPTPSALRFSPVGHYISTIYEMHLKNV
jgi:hypothetical protein